MPRNGKAFVVEISQVIKRKLKHPEWIEFLYNTSTTHGGAFEQLAFEAKSFEKLRRLVAKGISDEAAKKKIEIELKAVTRRFSQLLEQAISSFHNEEKKQFKEKFLSPTPDSFKNINELLSDFAVVKDFYLINRDKRDQI